MGIASETNRQLKKNKTRQRILSAALSLFAEKGYDNTSHSQIAKKAKVGYGTVYAHFAAKEDMLLELSIAQLSKRIDQFGADMKEGETTIDRLFNIVNTYWEWDMGVPRKALETFYAHRWMIDQKDFERIHAVIQRITAGFSKTIDRAKAEGLIDNDINTELSVHLLNSAYYRAVQEGRFNEKTRNKAKTMLDRQIRYLLKLTD